MALDKVDHKAMSIALQRLGVHRYYIDIIMDLYTIRGTNAEQAQLPEARMSVKPPSIHHGYARSCPFCSMMSIRGY